MKKYVTEYYCDLCGRKFECAADLTRLGVPVVYTHDDTEGKPCRPYVTSESHDLCQDCLCKVVVLESAGFQSSRLKLLTLSKDSPETPAEDGSEEDTDKDTYIVMLATSGEWDVSVSADSVEEALGKAQEKVRDAAAEACLGELVISEGDPIFVENKKGDIVWREDADKKASGSQHN